MFSEADKHQLYDELHDRLGEHAGGMLFTVVAHLDRLDALWRAEIAGVRGEMAKLEGAMAELRGEMKAQLWKHVLVTFTMMLALSGTLIGAAHFA